MKRTKYLTSYKHSPYSKISKKRIKKTKFIYRFTKKLILNNKKKKDIKNICDLGCANGEFIFYLANCEKIYELKNRELKEIRGVNL